MISETRSGHHRWALLRTASRAGAAALVAGLTLVACGGGGGGHPAGSSGGNATMVVAPNVTGPFVSTFNPFLPTAGTASGSVDDVIYEPLYIRNQVTYSYKPWLATSYTWSNGGKTVTLGIRKGVRWSDGTPLTASDVAYTFNLEKANPSLNTGAIPLAGASAPSATSAVVDFTTPAYTYLDPLLITKPVPEHIWTKVGTPTTFADPHPVGSGPYVLSNFTPQAITVTKNPKYWQAGKVAVQTMRYVSYDSASSIHAAIQSKQIDLEDHVFTDYYSLVKRSGLGGLLINTGAQDLIMNTTRYPLSITAVRQAINDALDRPALARQGLNNLQAPISSPTGLPPALSKDLAPEYRNLKYGKADPAKAKSLLTTAGFKLGSDGIFVTPKGAPLDLTIIQGTGQANLLAAAQVMKQQLKAAGIGLTIQSNQFPVVNSMVLQGNFDMYIDGDTAFDPFTYYRLLMDSADYKPVGTRSAYDLSRFQDPAVKAVFEKWVNEAPGSADATSSAYAIEKAMVTEVPAIPLAATAPQGVYNTEKFTGWPTKSDPYGLPEVIGDDAILMMLHVRPK